MVLLMYIVYDIVPVDYINPVVLQRYTVRSKALSLSAVVCTHLCIQHHLF